MASDEASPGSATDVVRAYYRAINQRRYGDAYELWESNGAASGKTFEEFRAGFSKTVAVEVHAGPGRVEGAAGSRYVEVPVRVVAQSQDDPGQEFIGKYVLRRSVVDGATPEQRAWHIYSAELRRAN